MQRRLMTRLAQFSSLSRQGELLCTQGLAYLLEDSDARSALADTIKRLRTITGPLTWQPEPTQQLDGGRPDLEACTGDGKPVVKIEAKLGAAFEMGQLRSYIGDLEVRSGGGLLLMLVPQYRSGDAKVAASSAFNLLAMPGYGPWQPNGWPNSGVAVITWEEILEVLQSVRSQPFANDLDQFRAMYEALTFVVESPTTDEEVLRWREREGTYINLVDHVSRRLTTQGNIMPMGGEVDPIPHGYRRRYVCLSAATVPPYLSVGVRDPFAGPYITPIWLRFRSGTPGLSVLRAHIAGSDLSQRKVESGGHIWIPLDVQLGLDGRG